MGSSILQAILGGVAGGAEGISQVREQRRLEEERKAEAERRARAERLQYVSAGFVPEASTGAMDMPGATPRKPFMSEVLSSGERMVLERSPQQMQHEGEMRKDQMQRGPERAAEERQAKQMGAFIESLPPEMQSRVGTALRAAQAGVPANVAQQLISRERAPERRLIEGTGQVVDLGTMEVTNIPGYRVPPRTSAGGGRTETDRLLEDVNSAVLTFARTPMGVAGRMPKPDEVARFRAEIMSTLGLSGPTVNAPKAPSVQASPVRAPSANDALRQQLKDAGFSEAEIDAQLKGR
jgi:hypothetical protein